MNKNSPERKWKKEKIVKKPLPMFYTAIINAFIFYPLSLRLHYNFLLPQDTLLCICILSHLTFLGRSGPFKLIYLNSAFLLSQALNTALKKTLKKRLCIKNQK